MARWLNGGETRRACVSDRYARDQSRHESWSRTGLPVRSGIPALLCGLWQRTHRRSRIGWTSFSKLNPRFGSFTSATASSAAAFAALKSGAVFADSWHPTQLAVSPGCKTVQLRIVCTMRPFSSSSWK